MIGVAGYALCGMEEEFIISLPLFASSVAGVLGSLICGLVSVLDSDTVFGVCLLSGEFPSSDCIFWEFWEGWGGWGGGGGTPNGLGLALKFFGLFSASVGFGGCETCLNCRTGPRSSFISPTGAVLGLVTLMTGLVTRCDWGCGTGLPLCTRPGTADVCCSNVGSLELCGIPDTAPFLFRSDLKSQNKI